MKIMIMFIIIPMSLTISLRVKIGMYIWPIKNRFIEDTFLMNGITTLMKNKSIRI